MRRLLLIAIVIVSIASYANPIDINMAKYQAEKFIVANSNKETKVRSKKTDGQLKLAYTCMTPSVEYPLFYVFNKPDKGGFLIMAGDDCIDHVLGYIPKGSFDKDNMPDGLQWLLEKYEYQIKYAIEHKLSIKAVSNDNYTNIEPLLTSIWNQNAPFNNLCPIGSEGKPCPTGCIATAIAQILYYHKWPNQGIGSHRYICNVDNNPENAIELSADFENTTYQWNEMLDSYENGAGSEDSKKAVATLMYHCGVSLDMLYKSGGSSPTSIREAEALKKYFHYSLGVKSLQHVSDEDFSRIVYNELESKRPVFVCGSSKDGNNGAHAFVCDGYKTGGYFHFNWGWSGRGDGYFLLTTMDPNGTWDFSYDHRIVYNIKPYDGEVVAEINVPSPGQLKKMWESDTIAPYATTLKIKGDINGTDVLAIRRMTGRDEYNRSTEGIVTTLDLSEVNIVDGGGCYYITENETSIKTQNGTQKGVFPNQGLMSTNIRKISLPNSVSSIGNYALAFCNDLEEVIYGNGLKEICFSAFNYTPLNEVIIPEGVKIIGPYAFCNMANLEKISIPKSVTKIDYLAFEKDDNVKEITCMIEKPFDLRTGNLSPFSEKCFKNATLYVPYGTAELYKQKDGWKNFSHIEEMRETGLEEIITPRDIKINKGTLCLSGVEEGDVITIYDMSGRQLSHIVCTHDDTMSLPIPCHQMLIVKIGSQQVKVVN